MEKIAVKICGIRDTAALDAAIAGGARYIGLVFYPPSPRAVAVEDAAALARRAAGKIEIVGLFVEPDDALLREATARVVLDWVQLHGHETPRRVAEIRAMTGKKIIKALPITAAEDFAAVGDYASLVDQFLFDAKAPMGALPGGNAAAFDWRLLSERTFPRPWMLAGGLMPENVAEAIQASGARAVDVSSGVEGAPGVKIADKIAAFCRAVSER